MRWLFILILSFFFTSLSAQNVSGSCVPTSNVKVVVCPNKQDSSVSKFCPDCYDCVCGLKATDKNYSIISYKLRWDAAAIHIKAPVEVMNNGAAFNEGKIIINQLRPGIFLEFSCIKAKDTSGKTYILQPLTFYVK